MLRKLIIGAFILSMACCAEAQEEQAVYVVNAFEKLNSHISPYSVPKTEAIEAQNVRINDTYGSVSKRQNTLSYGSMGSHAITSLHRYYKSDSTKMLLATGSTTVAYGDDSAGTFTTMRFGQTDGERWQWVTYKDLAIGMNGTDPAIKYDGKTLTTANTDGARTALNMCAELGSPFAELDTGTDLDASSWYMYKVVCYDGVTYSYSTARSNPILTGAAVYNIALTDIPLGPTGTTHRYVYRTVGNASRTAVLADTTYYLVSTIANNTVVILADSMSDDDADDDAAPTWATSAAGSDVTAPTGKYCTIHDERLFVAGNSTYLSDVYWSDQYNPNFFTNTDYNQIRPDDGDNVTFLKEQLGILVVGKTNTIQKFFTSGDPGTDWSIGDPITFTGCPAPYSAVNSPIGILYLAREGLYQFTGQSSKLISDAVTSDIRDIVPTNITEAAGSFFKDTYYLAYTSTEGGSTINDRVLVYNITRDAYVIDTMNISAFVTLDSGTDYGTLYTGSSDTDGYILAHNTAPFTLAKRKKSEINEGTFDDARVYNTEDSPIMEISWDVIIDDFSGTINAASSIIDREDTTGSWTSPVYRIDASDLYKLYWNESIGATGDIKFYVRLGASVAACGAATWSSAYTDPSGADVSGLTAAEYVQFRVDMTTTDVDYTPNMKVRNGYMFRLTYSREGSVYESTILSVWGTGWMDFGNPNNEKTITRIRFFYEDDATDDIDINLVNNLGNIDIDFSIDLAVDIDDDPGDFYDGYDDYKMYTWYPDMNTEEEPSPIGERFKFRFTEDGILPWTLHRMEIRYTYERISDS